MTLVSSHGDSAQVRGALGTLKAKRFLEQGAVTGRYFFAGKVAS